MLREVSAMPEGDDFTELIRRIRAGDALAARELIRRYEPAIRREARLRLGPSLRPLFDSMDLCQSVLGSFFVRVVAGQYELESPRRLMRLLIEMTRNKVREKARKRYEGGLGASEPVAADPDPVDQILNKDFVDEFRRRLSAAELVLWDRRCQDLPWHAIASELGATPESLRQQYSRAVHRVARELGVEEVG
jgi:RNA polymerase sigma-70 factor (ECF subfamily)